MKRTLLYSILSLVVFTSQIAQAQIIDDFSDGNFDQNPSWAGDDANFKVNTNGELQLNATLAGQSALFVTGNMPDSTIWDFEVRLGFDPSGSNLVRIYLQLDQTDLSLANGYYLEMGETGSMDAIRFFRLDGGAKTLIATGTPGLAAISPNLHIKVKRNANLNWTLDAATVGQGLLSQFTVSDAIWAGGTNRFFGVQCVYTASNIAKFYFDNFNIYPDVTDVQAPTLLTAQANSGTSVLVHFNEDLDAITAGTASNYSVNKGIGQPLSAVLNADNRSVTLSLQNALNTGNYTLQCAGIKDLAGNSSLQQTTDFQFVKVEAATEFDILITEIMADPSPSAGLPEVEWLEIFNRSAKIIDLSKLRIADATSAPIALPSFLMQPGQYIALTALANAGILQSASTGQVLACGFSTSMLNNDGDLLTLSDANGQIIDRVNYSVDWHTIPNKKDGGFSLERVNINLPCLESENWQSCPAIIGGTPTVQNASFSTGMDQTAPRLLKAFPESPTSILLTFTEGMDRATVEDAAAYQLDPPVAVAAAQQLSTDRSLVRLSLATFLQPSTLYTLSIETSVEDCSGNPYLMTDTVQIGLAEKPGVQDIVINEILFNPATGGSRYIEFYNRSNKIFDWSEFFMASNSDNSSSVIQIVQDRLFLPGEYHVFTSNASYIRDHYNNIIQKNVLQNTLPSLDDNADSIKLYWVGGGKAITIDSFFYFRGMHNALLSTSEMEGVALERIRTEGPTQSAANWTSASSLKTGAPGTPTLPNSQLLPVVVPESDLVSIPVARLSPDGDGYEDFLEIQYSLPKVGYAASMSIFDSDGNLIKKLVRQNLIGTAGTVRWDGDTDAGEAVKARPGIHILYIELFNPEGEVKRIKKAVAVVGKY